MNKWLRFSGIFGLVIFLFGLGGMLLTSGGYYEFLLVAHVALGVGLMFFWLFTYGIKNLGDASSVIKGRTTRFSANALAYAAIIGGILISINWIAHKKDKRWDFTEQQVYSIAEYSQKLMRELKQPLKIAVFKVNPSADQLRDLIDLYKSANPSKVTTEIIDPRAKPHLVEIYGMKPGNVIYLKYGEGDSEGKGAAISRISDITEEGITNAIIKLTRGIEKKVYYVQGHGEPDIKGINQRDFKEFASVIENEHLKLEGIILAKNQKMPSDAAAVILASPQKPLLPEEKELLIKYVEDGGRLLLFNDPRTTSDIKEIAAKFNIKVGENVVVDQVQRLFAAPALGVQPVVQQYGTHPVTKSFGEQDITIFNLASTIEPIGDESLNGLTVLAKSGESAWGESNVEGLFSEPPTVNKDSDDVQGPVSLAVAYEKNIDGAVSEKKDGDNSDKEKFEKISRVVVFGDSDFINNANIGVYANKDFALNALNWLAGEEGGISVRPKSMRKSDAPMEASTYRTILATSFLIPEIILLYGLYVWWRRRLTWS